MTEQNLPPKQLQSRIQKIIPSTENHSEGLKPVSTHQADVQSLERAIADLVSNKEDLIHVQPETLPVLSAFKDFLEEERSVTQRRFKRIISSFILTSTALVLILGSAIILYVRNIKDTVSTIDNRVESITSRSDTTELEAKRALSNVKGLAANIKADIDKIRERSALIEKDYSTRSNEVRRLNNTVAALRKHNIDLNSQIGDINSKWPLIQAELQRITEELKKRDRAANSYAEAAPSLKSSNPRSLTINVRPIGTSREVKLRLAIPE